MRFVESEKQNKYEKYNTGSGRTIAKCIIMGSIVTLSFTESSAHDFSAPKDNQKTSWVQTTVKDSENLIADFKSFQKALNIVRIQRIKVLDNLSQLKDDWDGDGAVRPNKIAIKNAYHLLSVLSTETLKYLHPEDIYPSAYGSVIMDFEVAKGLVSVEIGDKSMGFYTDFEEGGNYAAEGISTEYEEVPELLATYLS